MTFKCGWLFKTVRHERERRQLRSGVGPNTVRPSGQGGHRGGSFEDGWLGGVSGSGSGQQHTAVTSQEPRGDWCPGSDFALARKKRLAARGAPPPSPVKAGARSLPHARVSPRTEPCARVSPHAEPAALSHRDRNSSTGATPGRRSAQSPRGRRQAVLPPPARGSPQPGAPPCTPPRGRPPSPSSAHTEHGSSVSGHTRASVTHGHLRVPRMGRPD